MEQNFSLRPATTEDLSKIVEIESRAYSFPGALPWNEENFRAELIKPYSQFLVLTDDETDSQLAGYLVTWIMFDECEILNLVVDLPYRGRGYAKQMLRKIFNIAVNKGIRKISLDVRKSNMAAIQLYQHFHFAITHVRKGFYGNGEDAYHMVASLEEDLVNF